MNSRIWGLVLGVLADRAWGDPPRFHPVAGVGAYALWLERHLYHADVARGALYTAAAVVPVWLIVRTAHRSAPVLTQAVVTWASLGGRTLERVGTQLAEALDAGDTSAARRWIPWLCSRDPSALTPAGMARAGVESLAENSSDAALVPLILAATLGPEAVAIHRVVNTLDAMVGYHNPRYELFGRVPAYLDDALAYIPARIVGLIHVALAVPRGRAGAALRAWRRDAPSHPSPNAGVVEATAAGYLGVQLGGRTVYPHGVEERPTLGEGGQPGTDTLRDAIQLTRRAQLLVVLAAVATAGLWNGSGGGAGKGCRRQGCREKREKR